MPEMKNSFQGGKMNKDLDERLVPNSEYRDALNVEITTSNDSDVGVMQTVKGNTILSFLDPSGTQGFKCIGSISDDKNDKLYFFVTSTNVYGFDIIAEYNHKNGVIIPVCVDTRGDTLKFDPNFLITGVNIIDDLLFWTDNNTEPKRINITRGIWGSSNFTTHTDLMVRDISPGALPNTYVPALGLYASKKPIHEKHLTVIRKGPPTAPVLEMIDTTVGDWDEDSDVGGDELVRQITAITKPLVDEETGRLVTSQIGFSVMPDDDGDAGAHRGPDFEPSIYVHIYKTVDKSIGIRVQLINTPGGPLNYNGNILSGNPEIETVEARDLTVEYEKSDSIFQFKFPRFAYRYKYEDGEYSAFSPFTQPAFLPGRFSYLPKEGYNLGMVNRLRKLVIKDFIDERMMGEDVVAVDILYKDSNSTSIYSVKTIKRRNWDPGGKWDEWNGITATTTSQGIGSTVNKVGNSGWFNRTTGYLPITTEMIRAVLPANQLLRPWDNVPRKTLAQEIIGNRLVYGNYLQNYNLKNLNAGDNNIKININVTPGNYTVGQVHPEQIHAGRKLPLKYSPAKSIKSLRTYQLGVVYIDQYGRETPVFSESANSTHTTTLLKKDTANKANYLEVDLKNNPPDWATHFKFFIKETSNEYYNLAMDRWYNAEDGNVWISFPSAERNKIDEDTYLILKKEHDTNVSVLSPARYKVIAIENEAPRFIKLANVSIGSLQDDACYDPGVAQPCKDGSGTALPHPFGDSPAGFPLVDGYRIFVEKDPFELAGWKDILIEQDVSEVYFRVRSLVGTSGWYKLKSVAWDASIGSGVYILLSSEQFGDDMAHTSPNNSWFFRRKNCLLEIVKRIPEDKPEFEGRFFVKILKDASLIKHLHLIPTIDDGLLTVKTMQVQYIDPKAAQLQAAGSQTRWDGFGTRHGWSSPQGFNISIDEKNINFDKCPVQLCHVDHGTGKQFWSEAANNSRGATESSGWFIDKVEGFRPFKIATNNLRKDLGYNRNPHHDGDWFTAQPFGQGLGLYNSYKNNAISRSKMLRAYTINTYGHSGNNYLGIQDLKQNYHAVNNATLANSGGVGPSQGINKALNIIHLSYAGLNDDAGTAGTGPTWWNANWAFRQGQKHIHDIEFITKITTPGCLWKWEEDPGQVLYITVDTQQIDISTSDYDVNNRNRDTSVDLDGEPGVFLYNYAVFSDYALYNHHIESWDTSCVVIYTCANWISHYGKDDWASRRMMDEEHTNWVCQNGPPVWDPISYGNLHTAWLITCGVGDALIAGMVSLADHDGHLGSESWEAGVAPYYGGWDAHHEYPTAIYDAHRQYNRRRRFVIHAEPVERLDGKHLDSNGNNVGLGGIGPHFYLPTNDPSLDSHFDVEMEPLGETAGGVVHPNTGVAITTVAPGIRPDGMYTGADDPDPYLFDQYGDGTPIATLDTIPKFKRWDASTVKLQSNAPGSVTWEIVEQFFADPDNFSSTNPAIFETEPKEDVGLDIYHEVGQIYPVNLTDETIEQFVGPVHKDIKRNSFVDLRDSAGAKKDMWTSGSGVRKDIRVIAVKDNYVLLGSVDDAGNLNPLLDATTALILNPNSQNNTISTGDTLRFWRSDGSTTEAIVGNGSHNEGTLPGTWYHLVGGNSSTSTNVHDRPIRLPWFNCYSFGNGVESDRIRDDYNQITIDNGPKASTTIEEPYLEERRKSGFTWSGLYNSTSGVNDTNQFIQAEKITKDANPTYGSIQKLHARDSDLVAFCEDRVLKVLANKDALYNADGNTNLVATNRVLGAIKPFVGDFGISLNPESFASDSYRSYFSDTSRGAVLRLSRDGITPISDAGMRDWFADNLSIRGDKQIIGSFDDNKGEYNITLPETHHWDDAGILGRRKGPGSPFWPKATLVVSGETAQSLNIGDPLIGVGIPENAVVWNKSRIELGVWEILFSIIPSEADLTPLGNHTGYGELGGDEAQWKTKIRSGRLQGDGFTVSYSEQSKGWVSFKSWHHESGISLNNSYYTFKLGEMYEHHINETRNNFYGLQFDSSVDILFNKIPGIIKSFSTLNYEGSQAKVTPEINDNPNYYDNFSKEGWYVKEMISNAQELGEMEFWDKEDKWFSQIKGVKTEWLNDGTAGNIDPQEFSYQGIGNAYEVLCPDCPPIISWDCINSGNGCNCTEISGDQGEYATQSECENSTSCCGDAPVTYCCGSCNITSVEIEGVHCGCGGNYYEPTGFLLASLLTSVSIGDIVTGDYIPAGTTVVGIYDTMTRRIELSQDPVVPQPWKTVGGVTDYPLFTNIIITPPSQGYNLACYDPGDGSGMYSDLCDCVNTSMCCGNGYDYFITCPGNPIPSTVIYGCMDDGVTTDPWMVRNRPYGWTGSATNYNSFANVDDCSCEYISTPTPSFTCTISGGVIPWAVCYDPGDGSGAYSSYTACDDDCELTSTYTCSAMPSTGYTQIGCWDPGTGLGAYTSLAACQAACSGVPSWDCIGTTGVCLDPGTGNGQYATLSACQAQCIAPTYSCSGQFGLSVAQGPLAGTSVPPNTCIDLGLGTGQYSSLTLCQDNCCVPTLRNCTTVMDTWAWQGNQFYSTTGLYYPGQVVSYIDPVNGISNYYVASAVSASNFTPQATSVNPQNYPPPNQAHLYDPISNPNGYWEGCDVVPCPGVIPSWNCTISWSGAVCVDPGDGGGSYATLSECMQDPNGVCCQPYVVGKACDIYFDWISQGENYYHAAQAYYPGRAVSWVDNSVTNPNNTTQSSVPTLNYYKARQMAIGNISQNNPSLYPAPEAFSSLVNNPLSWGPGNIWPANPLGLWEACDVHDPCPGSTVGQTSWDCSGDFGLSVTQGPYAGQTIPPNTCIDLGLGTGAHISKAACEGVCGQPLEWEMRTKGRWDDVVMQGPPLFKTAFRRYSSEHFLRFLIPPICADGTAEYQIKVQDWWTSKFQTQNDHAGFDRRRELGIAISSVDYTSPVYNEVSFASTLGVAHNMATDLNGSSSWTWFVNNIQGTHISGIESQPHYPTNQNPSDDNFLNTNFTGSWSAYSTGGNTYLQFKIECLGDERFKYGGQWSGGFTGLWDGSSGTGDDWTTDSGWNQDPFQWGQNHDDGVAPSVRGKASSAFPGGLGSSFPQGVDWNIEPANPGVYSPWLNTWLGAHDGGRFIDSPNLTITGSNANGIVGGVYSSGSPDDVAFLQDVRDRALAGNPQAIASIVKADCESWDCNKDGTCTDPGNGLGQYPSKLICQANCQMQAQ